MILGVALGGSLSIACVILRGMFCGPLFEPYTLGISGGAALAIVVKNPISLTPYIFLVSEEEKLKIKKEGLESNQIKF